MSDPLRVAIMRVSRFITIQHIVISLAFANPLFAGISFDSLVADAALSPQAMFSVDATAPAATQRPFTKVFTVKLTPQGLIVSPGRLDLLPHSSVQVIFETSSKPQIFIRNSGFLKLDQATLTAEREGQTELLIYHDGQLAIVPVFIQSRVSDKAEEKAYQRPVLTALDLSYRHIQTHSRKPSKGDEPIRIRSDDFEKVKLSLRIVDERTPLGEDAKIYPVAGVQVRIAGGVDAPLVSDSMGFVDELELPKNGRVLVDISDPRGWYHAGLFEVFADQDSKVVRLHVFRENSFGVLEQIAGVNPNPMGSSLCGYATHNGVSPFVGAKISTDMDEAKVFYFNQYGYLDPIQLETSLSGRFCLFALEEGPIHLSLYVGQEKRSKASVGLYSKRHHEIVLDVDEKSQLDVMPLATPTSYEQMSGAFQDLSSFFRPVSLPALWVLGEEEPLYPLAQSPFIRSEDPLSFFGSRTQTLVNALEFESVVYNVESRDESDEAQHMSLFPRGFIEDLALNAGVAVNLHSGHVLVDFIPFDHSGNVMIELLNNKGESVGDGFVYMEDFMMKSVFFNVPPGQYQVLVHDGDRWLAADTVLVYSQTSSAVSLGRKLETNR